MLAEINRYFLCAFYINAVVFNWNSAILVIIKIFQKDNESSFFLKI
jgi:hypothetical protein